jgi:hypothetical protein
MIAVVLHIFAQGAAEHGRADRYEFRWALAFYGSDESFCAGAAATVDCEFQLALVAKFDSDKG